MKQEHANYEQERKLDLAGLLFGVGLAVGCAFVVYQSWDYDLGTFRRVGPGLLPFMLGLLGALMGLLLAWRSVRAQQFDGSSLPLRRLLFIGSAFVFFALSIEPIGLLGALFGTTIIGAFADADARPGETIVLALSLAGVIWLVFVHLLGLAIPLWPGVL